MSSLSQMNYYQENFNSIRFSGNLVARYQEREREKKDKSVCALFVFRSLTPFIEQLSQTKLQDREGTRSCASTEKEDERKKKKTEREGKSHRTRASEAERREAKIPKRIIISGTTSRRHSGINENFRVELQLSPDDGNEQPRSKLPFQSRAKAR